MIIPIIEPSAITFLTTFKCTASCRNCCFQCNPNVTKRMTYDEMKGYVDKCLQAYPNIKVMVLTGGECTIFWDDLKKIIEYASKKGLSTRIVTNAWWATTYRMAVLKIKELKNCGLNEINFSTGDDHQQWVPFKRVRNAALASIRLGLICAVNVETKDNSKFNIDKIISKDKVLSRYAIFCDKKEFINGKAIYFEKGIWAPMNKNEQENITYKQYECGYKFKPCDNLFSIIPINPYGEVLACCGITCERNPFLRLGNINKENIKTIYERAFKDIIKIWLYCEGPEKIERYIKTLKGEESNNFHPEHSCVLCQRIFCDPNNIDILKENISKFSSRVLLNYFMFNQ